VLHLASETPPRWVQLAAAEPTLLLLDHAHCEKKAASTAINLMFRYGDRPGLVRAMSALAQEELRHFDEVVALLDARGVVFERVDPSPYAARLYAAVRRAEPDRLLDTLLVCALIEARSCERMKRLAEGLPDAGLADVYRDLLAAEARHFHTYVELAREVAPEEVVRSRLAELAAHEATLLSGQDEPMRMHSRVAAAEAQAEGSR
jgi:tRNA-(ms[2]io[6]A)-hydroxylase